MDAFEVVNPLGSGKKKHEVQAVYFTVTNIPLHNISSVDQMELVMLYSDQDYKDFWSRCFL